MPKIIVLAIYSSVGSSMIPPLTGFSNATTPLFVGFNCDLFRCGCLQVGDRIMSVNHQNNLTLQEINSILEMGNDGCATNQKVVLQVEFDVADTIVPSSGVFTIKLAKRGPGLGITIQGKDTSELIRNRYTHIVFQVQQTPYTPSTHTHTHTTSGRFTFTAASSIIAFTASVLAFRTRLPTKQQPPQYIYIYLEGN